MLRNRQGYFCADTDLRQLYRLLVLFAGEFMAITPLFALRN